MLQNPSSSRSTYGVYSDKQRDSHNDGVVAVEENVHVAVRVSPEMGRYAIAAQPIRAGQILFEESAFAIGPKPHSPLVCLGCSKPLKSVAAAEEPPQRCALCGWPLCRPECDSAHLHYKAECAVFRAKSVRFYGMAAGSCENMTCMQLDCITPLRVLLAGDADPERWRREIEPMECHTEERRQREDTWQADEVNVVGYLRGPCGLRDRYTADRIRQACGLLEVNSFEGRTATGYLVRCIFPGAAVMAHACVPNTMHTIHPGAEFRIQVRATVDIEAGMVLAASYTYTSSGTAERQEHLRAGKFFTCRCARCLDPSELGTHFSSIRCRRCNQTDAMIVSTNPLDYDPRIGKRRERRPNINQESPSAAWQCNRCHFETPGPSVAQALLIIQTELDDIESMPLDVPRIERSESFIDKHQQLLANDHYMLTAVRHSLISMYGRVPGYRLPELNADQLEHKIALCKRVLDILAIVHPGMSRARALMLFEIHAPLVMQARADFAAGKLTASDLRLRLIEVTEMLLLCNTVLGWEAPSSAVAAVARLAKTRRAELLAECAT